MIRINGKMLSMLRSPYVFEGWLHSNNRTHIHAQHELVQIFNTIWSLFFNVFIWNRLLPLLFVCLAYSTSKKNEIMCAYARIYSLFIGSLFTFWCVCFVVYLAKKSPIVLLFHLHRMRSHFGVIEYMAAFKMHVIGIIDRWLAICCAASCGWAKSIAYLFAVCLYELRRNFHPSPSRFDRSRHRNIHTHSHTSIVEFVCTQF